MGTENDARIERTRLDTLMGELVTLLTLSGFTGVETARVPPPAQFTDWVRSESNDEDAIAAFCDNSPYHRVESDQGIFGVFFTHYMPMIDLTGTGVTAEEYLAGVAEHAMGPRPFVPLGDEKDLRRFAALLVMANDEGKNSTLPAPPRVESAPPRTVGSDDWLGEDTTDNLDDDD